LLGNDALSFLGDYIEDFDQIANNLQISLWGGDITLQDLNIKSNLFKQLNLPFEMKLGVIKNLNVKLPTYYFNSAPAVAKIDQIYLIVTPLPESEWKM
jgi:vacuolar protein sorting-associated protein 13A/C